MLVMPLLAVLADIVGIFGGALVMATFDVGFLQFYDELVGAVTAGDFVLGIVKAAVFGLTIAAIGCHRGLTTAAGATSVGIGDDFVQGSEGVHEARDVRPFRLRPRGGYGRDIGHDSRAGWDRVEDQT
jgi:hypothetical protein